MGTASIIQKGFPSSRELQNSMQSGDGGMLQPEVVGVIASKGVVVLAVDVALLKHSAVLHRLQGVGNAAVTNSRWRSDGGEDSSSPKSPRLHFAITTTSAIHDSYITLHDIGLHNPVVLPLGYATPFWGDVCACGACSTRFLVSCLCGTSRDCSRLLLSDSLQVSRVSAVCMFGWPCSKVSRGNPYLRGSLVDGALPLCRS